MGKSTIKTKEEDGWILPSGRGGHSKHQDYAMIVAPELRRGQNHTRITLSKKLAAAFNVKAGDLIAFRVTGQTIQFRKHDQGFKLQPQRHASTEEPTSFYLRVPHPLVEKRLVLDYGDVFVALTQGGVRLLEIET